MAKKETIDGYQDYLSFLDFLQEQEVFISGVDGTPRHMDTYMTVVSFVTVDKLLQEHPNKPWEEFTIISGEQGNRQIPERALVIYLEKKLGIY